MNRLSLGLLTGLTALSASTAFAQGSAFDRTKPPALRPPSRLKIPPVRSEQLPNGMKLYVIEMHEVPLVQFSLAFTGGGRLDQASPGMTSFTADMLDEGAGTRDAIGIASQAEFLGASLSTSSDWDASYVNLKTPRRTMGEALDLMADVVLRPTFKSAEVNRQRDLRLASILQQRDQPNTMAALAFNSLVFPAGHPYHQPIGGDSITTSGLDSAKVRAFYNMHYSPGNAVLVIAGDITLAEARAAVAQRFGSWRAPASGAAPSTTVAPVDRPTTVYLVDKPGAAQSVIFIGRPGVERSNPDYAAIEVMNNLLGGSFSSRLNQNLRETRGYTYGAGSGFAYRPLPGPFTARSAVRTNVTDSSLIEFFKEFRRIRDTAVDAVELERAKSYLALGLAADFETTSQMAGQVVGLLRFGLPMTYYDDYVTRVMAVTTQDVQRVARQYLQPDRFTIVVVGDLATIRPGIEALNLGPISVRDLNGNEIK
ncbi:MAG TPA: pitrilysin family protein [Gemmatimonadales bacterium]|nr:pitrilysin family protein [Gemmatimonadales bacterium]